jgi:hypothetical protein
MQQAIEPGQHTVQNLEQNAALLFMVGFSSLG